MTRAPARTVTEFTRGPIQVQLASRLREAFGIDVSTSLANRSPLGARAIRVQVAERDRETCAHITAWLNERDWVEAATQRGSGIYMRPTEESLRHWAGQLPSRPSSASLPVEIVIRSVPVEATSTNSLSQWRARVVARAAAAQLRWRGLRAKHVESWCDAASDEHGLTVAAGLSDDNNRIGIGPVDVAHGALRAQWGGVVTLADFRVSVVEAAEAVGVSPALLNDVLGEAVLAFLFARCERKHHARVSENGLARELFAFRDALAAIAHLESEQSGPGNALAVSELALELERLWIVAEKAAANFESAVALRALTALASRINQAAPHLSPDEPLTWAARQGIDAAFALSGTDGSLTNYQDVNKP